MINRSIAESIRKSLLSGKITIIYGARQVGKTTLAKQILEEKFDSKISYINGDDKSNHQYFEKQSLTSLLQIIGTKNVIYIDEAQKLPFIGENLKILHDSNKNLKILVTGSSSFELAQKTNESLAGRALNFNLSTFSIQELVNSEPIKTVKDQLLDIMTFGQYPDVYLEKSQIQKIRLLKQLKDSVILKDLLEIKKLEHPQKILELLTLLAYQIGSNVNISELATTLQISRETVINYIKYLEYSFIIYRVRGISSNMRKPETKQLKIYFYDLGIRNIIINNFDALNLRADKGAIFENFVINERKKINSINPLYNQYFYRDKTQKETDLVEKIGTNYNLFEIKLNNKGKYTFPKSFETISNIYKTEIITLENLLDFVL